MSIFKPKCDITIKVHITISNIYYAHQFSEYGLQFCYHIPYFTSAHCVQSKIGLYWPFLLDQSCFKHVSLYRVICFTTTTNKNDVINIHNRNLENNESALNSISMFCMFWDVINSILSFVSGFTSSPNNMTFKVFRLLLTNTFPRLKWKQRTHCHVHWNINFHENIQLWSIFNFSNYKVLQTLRIVTDETGTKCSDSVSVYPKYVTRA